MRVLLIGGGGREHALAWAIARSPLIDRLICAPGNPGMARLGECVDLDIRDFAAVRVLCKRHGVDLVVVGPEAPLVAGLADALAEAGIRVFGPSQAAARLEGSKGFTKDLCARAGIPTARYGRFSTPEPARAYLRRLDSPIVIKADGLAAGKGVVIADSRAEAERAVIDIMGGTFGEAGSSLVIEEYLEGTEASLFALVDGKTALPLAGAQDYKRIGEGDTGPNTGGMGAHSPAFALDAAMRERAMDEIVRPTVQAMAEAGTPYRGVLYAGLMITADGPKLIEYNVRFGDPECQVLMPRLASDLLPALAACAAGDLGTITIDWTDRATLTVVMAAQGYPGAYEKGSEIRGVERAEAMEDVVVFHAGTRRADDGRLLAHGGRVIDVTALGDTVADARRRAYEAVEAIDWPGGIFRRDIGGEARH